MISYPDARRFSPNPARDKARKELADAFLAVRRTDGYYGHMVARIMWRRYRGVSVKIQNAILEGLNGQGVN